MTTSAKIIRDSVSPEGHRLTTMEVTFHRFVLAEFNTHRMFSRNSASSRAIPTKKFMERVSAFPVEFGSNQPGMQAGPPLEGEDLKRAEELWGVAGIQMKMFAKQLADLGVHKQVTNRLLEPFMWHTVIVTATEWDNFFGLRANPMAQPEIRVAAEMMLDAYKNSEPELLRGQWHLPYVLDDELPLDLGVLLKISAARCARVSYLTHDGVRNIDKDLELFARLTEADPPHASPLEHVALPARPGETVEGNFTGWHQLRHNYWK